MEPSSLFFRLMTRRGFGQATLFSLASQTRLLEAQTKPLAVQQSPHFLGSLMPIMASIQKETGFPMDYAHRNGLSLEEWRRRGREEIRRALSYSPKHVPFDLEIHNTIQRRGYSLRVISFAGSTHYRVPAFLLVPAEGKAPYPAVLALHDHGGYFYHGKEKLVEMESEHPALAKFKKQSYGGRSFASELARRGFVVLVIDAFYWGDRRLEYQPLPRDLAKALDGLQPSQSEYVEVVNRYLSNRVCGLNTWLAFCGTSWMGIIVHDDRRSLDVLSSLPEVDKNRLGCLGLSVGGYRSTYLSGLDSRIRAAVIVGWMTSLPTMLDIPDYSHRGLPDAFGLHAFLDHPDIASLAAPDCATFVQQCARDELFTRVGMEQASDKIRRVYEDLKQPQRFQSRFYDVPHSFDVPMQEEAFQWLERWLG
jgi:dienelactone hydrolase